MKLLLGTNNPGKVEELSKYLKDLPLEITTLKEVGIEDAPEETGDTYEENALIKARYFYEKSGLPTLADDSGIEVEALSGELSVHTRRWGAGADATDKEWISYFLERMKNEENRKATFISVIAYIDEKGNEQLFHGTCVGSITETLESEISPGLPLKACFKPEGYDKVYENLDDSEKLSVNHRGRSALKVKEYFEQIFSS